MTFIKPAPNIDYKFSIALSMVPNANVVWLLRGAHDGFPAYEVFIGGQSVYFHTPKESEGQSSINPFNSGQTLASLFPPMEFDDEVSRNGLIPLNKAYNKAFIPPQPTQKAEPITRITNPSLLDVCPEPPVPCRFQ